MQYTNLVEFAPLLLGLFLSLYIITRMRLFSSSGMFFRSIDDIDDSNRDRTLVEVGGVAMFPVLLITLCISLGLPKLMGFEQVSAVKIEASTLRIVQVIAGCSLLYLVGLKNDMHGTDLKNKLLALFATSIFFPFSNLWICDLQGLFNIHAIPAYAGVTLTVILTMYIAESIALLDDIDGLGIGIATVVTSIFWGFCLAYEFTLGSIVCSALLGVTIPYTLLKLFSKKWKKTVIGNAGSYTIGYVMSYLSLSLIQQSGHTMPEGVIMIVVGILLVPMLDVVRMVRYRVKEGRAMLTPDRNLMHHRFVRTGIPPSLTPLVIISIILLFAVVNTGWVVMTLNLTILAIIDVALWIIMHVSINYMIHKHEEKEKHVIWEMTYGREAWEANIPKETIQRKQRNFGTMGLPKEVILGKELDFIPDGMNSVERNTKRLFDLFSSGIIIVLSSPLFLLSYILIKLDDGGPAIYAQERIGRFGRPFYIYKFRSMRQDAEKFGPALSHSGGDDDPRLTKVGRFLRAHHLDELPQLWNVFCGDMAFVGYRPERSFFIDKIMAYDPRYSFLYQIRPGVTSYATLYNGYTDTMEKMLRRLNYDLYYLEHRSFWFDIKILWLTFISIVFGKKF